MDHAAVLTEQNRLLGELYRNADPDVPVPTCPDWTLSRLLNHVGRGHRWAAQIVRERADTSVDVRSVPDGKPPADQDGAVAWLNESAATLLDAVAGSGADTPVWTFTGPKPAAWWIRRRLHEATVHGADAALALGRPHDLPADVAADGISEWLDLLSARPASSGPVPLDIGQTLHLHATDDSLDPGGEWLVHGDAVQVSWEAGHAKGQVAVRGRATDLLLALMRRIPADDPGLQIHGEPTVWHTWLERTDF